MADKPKYEKCIRHASLLTTWCGEQAIGFTFKSLDHAALNAEQQGRLTVCTKCAKKITELLAVR